MLNTTNVQDTSRLSTTHATPSKARRGLFALAALGLLLAVPVSGSLVALLEIFRDRPGGIDGLDGACAVTVSPDGEIVYVTAREDGALNIFRRDAVAESLTWIEAIRDGENGTFGLDGATAVAVSPDRRHVYTVARDDVAVIVFRREPDESLHFANAYYVGRASDALVTPDDRHLAVVGNDDSLRLFRRDPSLDHLALVDLEAGGFGLGGARAVASDPSGEDLFVTAFDDSALTVFRRDASRDALAFSSTFADGIGGVDGLRGAAGVAVAPDGRNLYVTAFQDDAVAIFDRDTATGELAFAGALRHGTDGIENLREPSAIVVSPDGDLVIVTSEHDGALTFFDRDSEGRLTFRESLSHGIESSRRPVESSRRMAVKGLATSPDGLHLYATIPDPGALVATRLRPPLFADGFESGDFGSWSRSLP